MDNFIAQASPSIKITTGSLDVLASGTFITANNQNAEIKLGNLSFELAFSSKGNKPTMQVEEANEGQKLIFKLDGFDNPLGSGSSKPLLVGQLNKKELYFAFDIIAYDSESTKKITYTFYLGGDAK